VLHRWTRWLPVAGTLLLKLYCLLSCPANPTACDGMACWAAGGSGRRRARRARRAGRPRGGGRRQPQCGSTPAAVHGAGAAEGRPHPGAGRGHQVGALGRYQEAARKLAASEPLDARLTRVVRGRPPTSLALHHGSGPHS
jgi:hypothetical protein